MKKFAVSFLFLTILSFHLQAQNLWVCAFNGSVDVCSDSGWKAVENYQKIYPTDSVRFKSGSSLSILDRKNDKIYAVQRAGVHLVASIVDEEGLRCKKQSPGLMSYLWNSLRGKTDAAPFRSSAGVVYRDENIDLAIAGAVLNSTSTLPIGFTLINKESGNPVEDIANVGDIALFRVENHSAMDLFVNVIDVDSNGNFAPCIPVTSAQIMTQLLIPANSDVLLESFPIMFSEPRGEDHLILVASPEWFDIDAVINAVRTRKGTSDKIDVAVFKLRVLVK